MIRTHEARRVGDKINLHIAFGGDLTGFWIIGEVVAVNLIEARRITPIKQNGDVVQLGAPVELELFDISCMYGKQGTLAIGLGNLETGCRLADVVSKLVGNFPANVADLQAGGEIHPSHDHDERDGSDRQQASQMIDGKRHLSSV